MAKPDPTKPDPALLELAERDPRAAYQAAHAISHAVEAAAIRAALRQCNGLVRQAAALLDIPRSTLNNLLLRTHTDIAREAKKMRPKGYRTGRPPVADNDPK